LTEPIVIPAGAADVAASAVQDTAAALAGLTGSKLNISAMAHATNGSAQKFRDFGLRWCGMSCSSDVPAQALRRAVRSRRKGGSLHRARVTACVVAVDLPDRGLVHRDRKYAFFLFLSSRWLDLRTRTGVLFSLHVVAVL
jgi:hypothetical protein